MLRQSGASTPWRMLLRTSVLSRGRPGLPEARALHNGSVEGLRKEGVMDPIVASTDQTAPDRAAVEKVLLVAGAAQPVFGWGRGVAPMQRILAGRAGPLEAKRP